MPGIYLLYQNPTAVIAHVFLNSIHWNIAKGGVALPSTGYIQVHAYTSYAQIPLKDVAVTITDQSGSAIAFRLTNRSGLFDEPLPVSVPDLAASQSPNTGIIPFTAVNLFARLENYEEIYIEQVQVFPDTITVQNLEFIPLSELPQQWIKGETFQIPPQNL